MNWRFAELIESNICSLYMLSIITIIPDKFQETLERFQNFPKYVLLLFILFILGPWQI